MKLALPSTRWRWDGGLREVRNPMVVSASFAFDGHNFVFHLREVELSSQLA